MQKLFKIKDFYGRDYSDDEGLRQKYIENVKQLEEKHDVTLPNIKSVLIGNNSNPFTTITLINGMELFAKESMIPSIDVKNKESVEKYKLEIESKRMG